MPTPNAKPGVASRRRSRPPRRRPGAPCRSRALRSSRCACRAAQPLPLQPWHSTSSSADGSVYGKEARPEPRLDVGVEELLRERVERALEIAEADALVDDQPFDLREHRRVRRVEVVAAIDAARRDDPHRRLHSPPCSESACPTCACAAASPAGRRTADGTGARQIERVLHVARRMLGRHVQRFEVVPVVFELGAVDDLVAHRRGRCPRPARAPASADDGGRPGRSGPAA